MRLKGWKSPPAAPIGSRFSVRLPTWRADFVVAVMEAEHRPLMRERFAEWEHIPNYWNVHDVEDTPPAEALNLLAEEVRILLQQFRGNDRARNADVVTSRSRLGSVIALSPAQRPTRRWRRIGSTTSGRNEKPLQLDAIGRARHATGSRSRTRTARR
jgi:hypothetical protein